MAEDNHLAAARSFLDDAAEPIPDTDRLVEQSTEQSKAHALVDIAVSLQRIAAALECVNDQGVSVYPRDSGAFR